jgi:hypothetical protein
MASIKKIQKNKVGFLFKHNNRTEDDGVQHSNETIDPEYTHLNYHFKKGTPEDIHKVIRENGYYYMNRENSNPIVEIVVTLPRNVRDEDEEKFFESVYNFYCNDFGEQNIINAVVHKDEVTPHIHIDAIPVREIDREHISKNFEKLIRQEEERIGKKITHGISSKDVITREYLTKMHPRLSQWVAKDLGYLTEILNGKTAGGNKTVMELKNIYYEKETEKAKEVMKSAREEAELMEKNIQFIVDKTTDMGLDKRYFDAAQMLEEQKRLIMERDIYRKALLQHGITNVKIPKEARAVLDKAPNMSGKLTYKSGLIVPKSGEITVIETYIKKPRRLPQQYLIDEDPKLSRLWDTIAPRDLFKVSGENDYYLFPTDELEHTFRCLVKLKEKEKEIKKLNMPKISNDTFNLAEAVLRQCSFDTDYYYTEQNYLEDLERDKDMDVEIEDDE